MVWQADSALNDQADLYILKRGLEAAEERNQAEREVDLETNGQGIQAWLGRFGLVRERWTKAFRSHSTGVLADLVDLIEEHETLTVESAAWIQTKLEAHLDEVAAKIGSEFAALAKSSGHPSPVQSRDLQAAM